MLRMRLGPKKSANSATELGDRLLSSAGTGRTCAVSVTGRAGEEVCGWKSGHKTILSKDPPKQK